jgi:hypothetical protein
MEGTQILMRRVLRQLPVVLLALLCIGSMYGQQQGPAPGRRALVIANSKYPAIATLPAVTSGLAALQPVLAQLRFDVRVVENTTLEQIDGAITKLAKDTLPGDVALVFYLGLAVQSLQENYLLPAGFNPATTQGVDYEAYSMRRFASMVEERQPSFFGFIVDAAWEVPVLRQKFPDAGLVRLDPERPGALFAMSASPGKSCGDGSRSLYIQALADALRQQGLTLNQIVDAVKRSVSEASGGVQMPSEVSTVVRDFYVNPKPADLTAWEAVRDRQDIVALREFAEKFRNSPYAAEARTRIEDLDWRQSTGKDAAALRAFLARYPESAGARHRKEAETELSNLQVLDALQRYKAALEGRDINLLKAVWPGLTKQQLSSFQSFFRDARSIAVEAAPAGPPVVAGDSATIRAKRAIQFPGQGLTNDVVALKLKRSGTDWVIDTIAVEAAGK